MFKLRHSLLPISVLVLSACATTPNPDVVCTSDWISKRADKAIDRIESRTDATMKNLERAGQSWAKGKNPGPLQMFALTNSLKSLEKELKSGRGIQDLKTLSMTCNDPMLVTRAMGDFMRDKGLSEGLISFIEGLSVYQDLLRPDAAPYATETRR